MNVIITGTSRGIGLELCRQAVAAGHRVLAVARKPEKSAELMRLKSEPGKGELEVLQLDLRDKEMPEKLTAAMRDWPQLDLLINNAGVLTPGERAEDFLESFHTNSVAPFLVTKACLPRLKQSEAAKAICITSQMGSIADNSSGGYYAYRASKAALNAINKSLAVDHPWLTCLVLHPGWVQTEMGGAGAKISPEDSAEGLWKVIRQSGRPESGTFLNYQGERIPW